MISELDTARMELDNKIREKRELMQAHAAYVEEMERQHALRVDELDTLVEQYRGTIWQYEAKVHAPPAARTVCTHPADRQAER